MDNARRILLVLLIGGTAINTAYQELALPHLASPASVVCVTDERGAYTNPFDTAAGCSPEATRARQRDLLDHNHETVVNAWLKGGIVEVALLMLLGVAFVVIPRQSSTVSK